MEVSEFLQNNIDAEDRRDSLEQEAKDSKPTKVGSFDLLTNINFNKVWVDVEDRGVNYQPFLINRTLSYGRDSIMYANEMNIHNHIDNQLHFDYFINILRKSKRFNKGFDRSKDELVRLVMEYYNFTYQKSLEAISLLSEHQIATIKQKVQAC